MDFIKPKWIIVLAHLYNVKESNTINIAKQTNISYTTVLKIVKYLQEQNMVNINKKGRDLIITLTNFEVGLIACKINEVKAKGYSIL